MTARDIRECPHGVPLDTCPECSYTPWQTDRAALQAEVGKLRAELERAQAILIAYCDYSGIEADIKRIGAALAAGDGK